MTIPLIGCTGHIDRAADRIADVLEGQLVEKASFSPPRLRRWGKVLSGERVRSIETRGKAMLTHFEHGWSIYSHNQLYGIWYVATRGQLPDTTRSLRLALHTSAASALLYSASDIEVWRTDALDEHPFLARLGPDILDQRLQWREIVERLGEARFTRKSLATLYLDQGFIAGIGNYLRAEILFDAALHPDLTPAQLSRGELGRLARSTLEISRRSYRTAGTTVAPRMAGILAKQGLPYEKRRFMVFGREGRPCRVCQGRIKRLEANSRRIYLCPKCQPRG